MRAMLPILLLAFVAACGGEPPPLEPSQTAEGRKCSQAHASWLDSLEDEFHKAGQNMPEGMPTKEAYIEKCYGMQFTEEQAKCLDPKRRSLMPEDCKASLEPVKDKVEQLDKMFTDAIEASQNKDEDKPEGEAAEGEEAPAEGEAAPAEGEATE